MGAPPSAALHPESDIRARIPPEMSNYYCHPGKAGGSPLDFSGVETATEWSGGSVINLGGLAGSTFSGAAGINDAGQVVGCKYPPAKPGALEFGAAQSGP